MVRNRGSIRVSGGFGFEFSGFWSILCRTIFSTTLTVMCKQSEAHKFYVSIFQFYT